MTATCGGVFAGGGAVTFTVKVAGARPKEPPVLFEVCEALIVADPCADGVTVRARTSPQEPNVTEDGLTVATDELLEEIERTSVLLPVRLQPFLPSPFRGVTYRFVVPFAPPT